MASSTFALVLFMAVHLLFVPGISAYRVDNEEQHECRDQMQHQSLSHCKQFIAHGSSQYIVLQSRVEASQQLQECCGQLRQVIEKCRCKDLRHIVQEQARKGEMPRRDIHRIVSRAENLPETCRLSKQRCNIWSGVFYDDYGSD